MVNMVKCIDCGYLTLRRNSTRELVEVEAEIRDTGEIPKDHYGPRDIQPLYDPPLICFRNKFKLYEEQNAVTGVGPAGRILAVINKERPCDKFKKWVQGFTPKQHVEMDLIERQQASIDRKDRRDWWWRIFELFVMAVIVTAVSILGNIWAALVERGSLLKDKPQVNAIDQQQPTTNEPPN
jgi:hypothetical protein